MRVFELIYRNGDQKGDRIPLQGKRLLIGRDKEADLQLSTLDVSRKHCVLIRSKKGVYIQDLGSRNSTKLNGIKIDRKQPVRLSHRDKLQVGRWKFRCLISDPAEQAAQRPNKPDKPSKPAKVNDSRLRKCLHELDELATLAEFSSLNHVDQADSLAPPASKPNATKATVEATDTVEHKTVEASEFAQDSKSKTTPNDSQKDAEKKPSKEPEQPAGPQKLPEHLRPKRPNDSTEAAELALRKLLGQ